MDVKIHMPDQEIQLNSSRFVSKGGVGTALGLAIKQSVVTPLLLYG